MDDRVSRGIAEAARASSQLLARVASDDALIAAIEAAARRVGEAVDAGHKLLVAGNGGSAAQAQHLAAELVGRLTDERPAVAALALTTDTSILTALANDYGYDRIFVRQIQALGRPGDVLMAFSTSGQSGNILAALREARAAGLATVGLTGAEGGAMAPLCDHLIAIPTTDTVRIQEAHLVVSHMLCGLIEQLCHPDGAGASLR